MKIKPQFATLFILLLAYELRLFQVAEQSFWWDEVRTVASAQSSLHELMQILLQTRNHMPLYFVLMQFWVNLGSSEFVLRYFSVILGVLGVGFMYGIGRFIGGHRTGWLAAFLLAFSPFHIWYSQEARMYTLVAAAAIMAHYFLCRLIWQNTVPNWLGYTLAMVTAVYTHYLCFFILAAHYTFFSLSYRPLKLLFRQWIIYGGLVGVLFTLWGAMIMSTGGFTNAAISWIPPAQWYEPFFTLLSLSVGPTIDPAHLHFYLVPALFLAAIALCFFTYRRHTLFNSLILRLLLCWLLVPVLLTYFISLDWPIPQKRSIYIDRYFILSLPALLLLVAWGLHTLTQHRQWLLWAVLLLLVWPIGLSLNNLYFHPTYAREDWRAALHQLEAAYSPNDGLLLDPGQTLPISYYLSRPVVYEVVPSLLNETEEEHYEQEEMTLLMNNLAQRWQRLWLISAVNNGNAHGFPQERNQHVAQIGRYNLYKSWLDAHYPLVQEWTFPGIHLGVYNLTNPEE